MEAKWLKDGHKPTLEEYMSVSMMTCAHGMILARSYVGRGDTVTEETFKWVATFPPLVKATCWILRFMDDIASHKVLINMFYLCNKIILTDISIY